MTPRLLVVGGTGVLREVTTALVRSYRVVVVSRRHGHPPVAGTRVVADTARPSTRLPGTWDAAVVYGPAIHPDVLRSVARTTLGPVVLVLPSAMVLGPIAVDRLVASTGAVPVVLGWTGPRDAPRWHSEAEIGVAAVAGLTERHPVLLGRLSGPSPA